MSHDPHCVIIRGGIPTAQQVAALIVALTPVSAAPARPDDDQRAVDRPSGWIRAARLEGLGGRTVAGIADLGNRR